MRSLPAGRDVKFSVLEYGSILRIIHLGATAITTSRPRRARTTTANRTSGRGATSSGRGRCRNRPVTLSRRLSPHRPIAWIFFYLAIRRVNILIKEGKQSEAKAVWIQTKWGAFGCVETNQCVGCTKSFLGDDAAVLARSSGEEPASPRRRAGVASMAWRTTRRCSTNAP